MESVVSEQECMYAALKIGTITENINSVILGKEQQVSIIVQCMLAEGHVLIEDVPGIGKTSLAAALAKSIGGEFRRIQFTPDIMPSDITGFSMLNRKTGEFEYRPGAAVGNFVLADEINRAPAKTQSALLEMMEERQVTVDCTTHQMPRPFMVLATQNPIEAAGTYRLPEAQIDRFMVRISLGYPSAKNELEILKMQGKGSVTVKPVIEPDELRTLIELTRQVLVQDRIADYIIRISDCTRHHPDIRLGVSPRGSLALYRLCCAHALTECRNYVIPDDVQMLVPFVFGHRLILSEKALLQHKTSDEVLNSILKQIDVPVR